MDIIEIPKSRPGAIIIRLFLRNGYGGKVKARVDLQAPMSGTTHEDEYESAEQAKEAVSS